MLHQDHVNLLKNKELNNKSLQLQAFTTAVLNKSLELQAATTAELTASLLIGWNTKKPCTTAVLKSSLLVQQLATFFEALYQPYTN